MREDRVYPHPVNHVLLAKSGRRSLFWNPLFMVCIMFVVVGVSNLIKTKALDHIAFNCLKLVG